MWYLLASYNGKLYNLGAGLNQECCAQMMTVYYNHFASNLVKCSIVRECDLIKAGKVYWQVEFIKQYKRDHFMVAQLENYDVSVRFE